MEITRNVISGEGVEKNKGKGTENKKHKWYIQTIQGEFKNSIGNEEAILVICTIHGHRLMVGADAEKRGVDGDKDEKKWGNCNNMIN